MNKELEFVCPFCGTVTTLVVTNAQYKYAITPRNERKQLVQNEPSLAACPPHVRELFITGMCYNCQENLFGKIKKKVYNITEYDNNTERTKQ